MPGPLIALAFPTPADLLAAGWSTWWRQHKLPPSPDQLLTFATEAFWIWRDDLMQEHSNYLAARLGDRLLPLFDLVQLQLRRSVLYSTGHAKSTDLRSNIDY